MTELRKYPFEVGDKVIYRGAWGDEPPVECTITDVGEKNGRRAYGNSLHRWGYADQYTLPD